MRRSLAYSCAPIVCLLAANVFAHPVTAPECSGDFIASLHLLPVTGGRAIVAVANGKVAIMETCAATAARIKPTRRATTVRAVWSEGACSGVSGRVRLRGTIAQACSLLKGTLTVGRRHETFRGVPSTCGDGVTDPNLGEQCDGGGCGPGTTCVACTCVVAVGGTTTSTVSTTTTSTTVCTALQSSCTSSASCCSPGVCSSGVCCLGSGQPCQDSTDCCSGCCDENQLTCVAPSAATCL